MSAPATPSRMPLREPLPLLLLRRSRRLSAISGSSRRRPGGRDRRRGGGAGHRRRRGAVRRGGAGGPTGRCGAGEHPGDERHAERGAVAARRRRRAGARAGGARVAAGGRDRDTVDDHQTLELLEQAQVVLQLEEAPLDRDRERDHARTAGARGGRCRRDGQERDPGLVGDLVRLDDDLREVGLLGHGGVELAQQRLLLRAVLLLALESREVGLARVGLLLLLGLLGLRGVQVVAERRVQHEVPDEDDREEGRNADEDLVALHGVTLNASARSLLALSVRLAVEENVTFSSVEVVLVAEPLLAALGTQRSEKSGTSEPIRRIHAATASKLVPTAAKLAVPIVPAVGAAVAPVAPVPTVPWNEVSHTSDGMVRDSPWRTDDHATSVASSAWVCCASVSIWACRCATSESALIWLCSARFLASAACRSSRASSTWPFLRKYRPPRTTSSAAAAMAPYLISCERSIGSRTRVPSRSMRFPVSRPPSASPTGTGRNGSSNGSWSSGKPMSPTAMCSRGLARSTGTPTVSTSCSTRPGVSAPPPVSVTLSRRIESGCVR